MGLRSSKVEKPETVNEETVTETKTEEKKVEVTETAVAVKKETAVAVVEAGVVPSIASLENLWNPEEYGNVFPRIKAASGCLMNEKTPFGEYLDVQVLSHSPRWFVTPISKPGDNEASKFCRASYDGKNILDRESGESMTIEEYTDSVDGYEFRVGKYHDIYCIIFNAAKNADKATDLGIVQVSVSPTAVKEFTSFKMQANLNVKRGKMLPSHQNCMRLTAEPASNKKGDDYTAMKFTFTPLEILKDYTPIVE